MAKVALVQPVEADKKEYSGHLGISYLSSFLKKMSHEVLVADVSMDGYITGPINSFAPDFVGITIWDGTTKKVGEIISVLRASNPETKYIIGGPEVTLDTQEALIATEADFGVVGGGIPTIEHIIQGDLNQVGIAHLENGKLVSQGRARYNVEQWMVDVTTIPDERKGNYTTIRSIGCDYGQCDFCRLGLMFPDIETRPVD